MDATRWSIGIQGDRGVRYEQIIWLGTSIQNERSPQIEDLANDLRELQPTISTLDAMVRTKLLQEVIPQMLQRELIYRDVLTVSASYSSKLIGWVEIPPYLPDGS